MKNNELSAVEMDRLKEILEIIETEQLIAWGLHRFSGGFVHAEFDEVDDDKIWITITDGIQSDCCNSKNVTHLSLCRNTLKYTD